MTDNQKFHFVVLAAQRKGVVNPLAEAAGVSHKCIIEMGGKPLIEYVVGAIANSGLAKKITISIEDETPLEKAPYVKGLMAEGLLEIAPSKDNLYESAASALQGGANFPAVITTADNVLLTSEMIRHFCKHAENLDAAIALIDKQTLLAKYPDGQRNFHKFKDGEYSNCNLYGIFTPKALSAASIFKGGGQFARASVKQLIEAFGLFNMIAYKLAWHERDVAFSKLGGKLGVNLGVVDMPFPEAPIDVDNERTKNLAEKILLARMA